MSSFPGSLTSQYEPVRRMARGGFGEVHLARDRRLDRQVVVKLLLSGLLDDPEQVSRFQGEARVTAQLRHPHVVTILDHLVVDGVPCIVYEYLEGRDLQSRLEEGPIPLEDAITAVRQVCDALSAAHDRGILHRDVKAPNVLGAGPDHYKLTDFGIAKWQNRPAVKTQTGMVLGTPTHMAPELIRGAEASPASDVYAAGVLLFELLAGTVPFPGPNVAMILDQQLNKRPPAVSSRRPEVKPVLDAIVARALEKDPRNRFDSAAGMRDALQALLDAIHARPGAAAPRPTGGRTRALETRPGMAGDATTAVRAGAPSGGRPPRTRARLLAGIAILGAVAGFGIAARGPRDIDHIASPAVAPGVGLIGSGPEVANRRWRGRLSEIEKLIPRPRGTNNDFLLEKVMPRGTELVRLRGELDALLADRVTDPNIRSRALICRALIAESEGHLEKAGECLEEARKLDPGDRYLAVFRKRLDPALEQIRNAPDGNEMMQAIVAMRDRMEADPVGCVTELTQLLDRAGFQHGQEQKILRSSCYHALIARASARRYLPAGSPGRAQAMQDADDALGLYRDVYWAWLIKAELAEEVEDPRAEEYFRSAVEVAENVQAHRGLARRLGTRDPGQAVATLEAAISKSWKDPTGLADAKLDLARQLLARGPSRRVADLLAEGCASLGHVRGPWLLLFEVEVATGRFEKILEHFKGLRARSAETACVVLGDLLAAPWFAGHAKRRELLDAQFRADPGCAVAFNKLDEELRDEGDEARRQAVIEEALKISPPLSWAVKARADSLNEAQKYEEALQFLDRIEFESKRALLPEELLPKASAQTQLGLYEEARETVAKFRKDQPDNGWGRLQEGVLDEKERRLPEAEAHFRALLLDPGVRSSARKHLVDLLRASGRGPEADAIEAQRE